MSCEQEGGIPRYWHNQEQRYIGSGSKLFKVEEGRFRCALLGIDTSFDKVEEKLRGKGFNEESIEMVLAEIGIKKMSPGR
jgi:hypothetical protein